MSTDLITEIQAQPRAFADKLETMRSALEAVTAKLAAVTAERDAARAEVARLREEVASLQEAGDYMMWCMNDCGFEPDSKFEFVVSQWAELRAALRGDTAQAQPINSADGVTWHTVKKPAPAGGEARP